MESRELKRNQMYALIQEYQSGEETQSEFCARVGLKLYSFRYWLNRFVKAQAQSGGFVRVTGNVLSSQDKIELRYPNGVRVGLGRHPNAELLAQLIRLW